MDVREFITDKADSIAMKEHGCTFYSLPEDLKYDILEKAWDSYNCYLGFKQDRLKEVIEEKNMSRNC